MPAGCPPRWRRRPTSSAARRSRTSRSTQTASRVQIDVRHDGGRLAVAVADDGVGGADASRGSGLRGLADRVEALGGQLMVESPPGGGTRLLAEIPSD